MEKALPGRPSGKSLKRYPRKLSDINVVIADHHRHVSIQRGEKGYYLYSDVKEMKVRIRKMKTHIIPITKLSDFTLSEWLDAVNNLFSSSNTQK